MQDTVFRQRFIVQHHPVDIALAVLFDYERPARHVDLHAVEGRSRQCIIKVPRVAGS